MARPLRRHRTFDCGREAVVEVGLVESPTGAQLHPQLGFAEPDQTTPQPALGRDAHPARGVISGVPFWPDLEEPITRMARNPRAAGFAL